MLSADVTSKNWASSDIKKLLKLDDATYLAIHNSLKAEMEKHELLGKWIRVQKHRDVLERSVFKVIVDQYEFAFAPLSLVQQRHCLMSIVQRINNYHSRSKVREAQSRSRSTAATTLAMVRPSISSTATHIATLDPASNTRSSISPTPAPENIAVETDVVEVGQSIASNCSAPLSYQGNKDDLTVVRLCHLGGSMSWSVWSLISNPDSTARAKTGSELESLLAELQLDRLKELASKHFYLPPQCLELLYVQHCEKDPVHVSDQGTFRAAMHDMHKRGWKEFRFIITVIAMTGYLPGMRIDGLPS
ncbi:hypothetical protein AJ80_06920 [Polytolypa hystricis UAMH7299]|uniref:Uncharacterized protein n=1 Tax=Polytolypa hystricis (strain UAMH7299) TaxID=1447883 RepID=A0A2B7XJQ4_POLH7|nr:hypothetical protein AJ80_06920 [Polytolypa hystricis UAMH7299]